MAYRKGKRKARVMRFRYQTYYDVQTRTDTMQVLQWSVGGQDVINRCRHLFGAFKYFRLGKVSVKFVPASTLPVDPQGLSLDPDDPYTVDPVDQMNKGLVRITNGQDVFTDVSRLTDRQQELSYKTMLLDPRWSKFNLQSGFRRSAYPLYWQVGQLAQDKYPGSTINVPNANGSGSVTGVVAKHLYDAGAVSDDMNYRTNAGSSARGLFQTGMRGRLGFLPTDYYQQVSVPTDDRFTDVYGTNNVPEVKVITAILPKASKTVYFYRVYVTEEVLFKSVRSSIPYSDPVTGEIFPMGNTGLDNFLNGSPLTVIPTNAIPDVSGLLGNTGNNGEQMP